MSRLKKQETEEFLIGTKYLMFKKTSDRGISNWYTWREDENLMNRQKG